MPSSASPSVLAELQAAGENLNTWGDTRLNTALEMLEASGHGLTSHTLTANKSLTYTNFTATDGTDYVQKIAAASNGSYTLTLGGYERAYLIWNASSYDQTIACSGGGTSVTVYAGEVIEVYCDGTNVVRSDIRRILGALTIVGGLAVSGAVTGATSVEGLTTPTSVDTDHAANVQFVLDQAFAALSGDLPGQSGNQFASLTTNGSAASWEQDIQPEVITANTTAVARRRPYLADLSSSALTLTLPASPSNGDIVPFMTDQNAATNNLTIARNGETIGGLAEDMTVELNGFSGLMFYTGSDWKVVAR